MKLYTQIAQNECGLCCIASIASNYGFVQNLKYFRTLHKVGRDGLSVQAMVGIFDKINLDAQVIRYNSEEDFLKIPTPFIVLTNKKHYMIIEKIKKGTITVLDPANGTSKIEVTKLIDDLTRYCIVVSPKKNFSPLKDNTSELRYIKKSVISTKSMVIAVIITSCFVYATLILIPLSIQLSIDAIIQNGVVTNKALLYVIIACVVFLGASFFKNRAVVSLSSTLYSDLSKDSMSHLFKIPYTFFDNHLSGEILFRFNLLDSVRTIITGSLIPMILDFGSTIIVFLYLSLMNFKITLLLLITLLLISIIIKYFNNQLLNANKQELNQLQKTNESKTEIIQSIFQIKCLRLEELFKTNYYERFDQLMVPFKKRESINAIYSTTVVFLKQFLPFIFLVFLTIYSTSLKLSIGELFAFYSLIGTLFTSYIAFFQNLSNFSLFKSTLYYINDLLDEPIEEREGVLELKEFESMSFDNVSFKYNDTAQYVVKDVDFEFRKGESIAFVGSSGSGKSTIVKLIMGLYKTTHGTITINNIIYDNYAYDDVSQIFSIVPQNPIVFNKSIRDNISLNNSAIEDERIIKALTIAELYNEVKAMPMGINTMIINQGANISGGQLQRLAIARAIVQNPQVLILDEATSALDTETEKRIFNNLQEIECACVLISHRISTVSNCSNIFVMQDAQIREEGTSTSLMKTKGIFFNLVTNQIMK